MQDDPEGFDIRYTEEADAVAIKQWLMEPGVLRWFPMCDEGEVDDAAVRWASFSKFNCSLTVIDEKIGKPCGIATLYLQPYKKIAHHCEFGIIVGGGYRGKGIGSMLLKNLIHMGKNKFNVELLSLQVYEGNPAIRLYSRFGFEEYGRQTHWIKEDEGYRARIFMERHLVPPEEAKKLT